MEYRQTPVTSSPPLYDSNSPPRTHSRSERDTDITDDNKFKRRRLDNRHPSSDLPPASRSYSLNHASLAFNFPASIPHHRAASSSFHSISRDSLAPMASEEPLLWDEDSALTYLASGFPRDLMAQSGPLANHPRPFRSLAATEQGHLPEPPRRYPDNPPLRSPVESSIPAHHQRAVPPEMYRQTSTTSQMRGPPLQNAMPGAVPLVRDTPYDYRLPHQYMSLANEPLILRRPSSHPAQNPPSGPASPSIPEIRLILTRATHESINALMEHKRECPACQLEFEVDNFTARVTCCDTSIHVACLSAWVNSATYAKSRTCMKCRRAIDARRSLNSIIPPVTDELWDKDIDFNVPPNVKLEQKIVFIINARPDRSMRRPRPSGWGRHTSAIMANADHISSMSSEARQAISNLRRDQVASQEGKTRLLSAAQAELNLAIDDDRNASSRLMQAQLQLGRGEMVDLTPLIQKCEQTGRAMARANSNFHAVQKDIETTIISHAHRLQAMMQDAMLESLRRETRHDERVRARAMDNVSIANSSDMDIQRQQSRSFSSSSSEGD